MRRRGWHCRSRLLYTIGQAANTFAGRFRVSRNHIFSAALLACAWLSACTVSPDDAPVPEVVLPVVACEALAATDLAAIGGAGSRVGRAELGEHEGITVCEVDGTLAPSIGFSVVLPTTTWRQRYLQTGCGGLCGNISLRVGAADGCLPLTRGDFVIASSNMGHQGRGGAFGVDPQKRIDFAHRGMHLTAVVAKALIDRYYGRPPAYSYFSGCSDGGREGLMEAQRYPDDFDGIIAGAPAMNFSVQNSFYHAWQARSNTGTDGQPILRAERLPILNDAVISACDDLDGLSDGLITDPRACSFDARSIECSSDDSTDDCLTAAEADAANRLYRGPRDASSGLPLTLGGPQPGSELSWAGVFVPKSGDDRIFSAVIANDALGYLIYETNPPAPYSIDRLDFDAAAFDAIRPLNGLYNSTDPDLNAYQAAGGRLILWHGWSDPHISPINTIAYVETVESMFGREQAETFMRLFLLPGMFHCGGGNGPNSFDMLTAMMDWVEKGVAPEMIVASHPDSGTTRPVYNYPLVASWSEEGSPNDAANFEPGYGARGPAGYEWLGQDFFLPGRQLDCAAVDGRLSCTPE